VQKVETVMEEGTRADANMRLKRIAGQVAGIERMLADDRYCVDILLQIAAVQGALGEVGRVVLASHVQTCLAEALAGGNAKERRTKVDELVDILSRCSVTGASGRTRSPARKPRKHE
jgi:CsoR family transcriptional regulator, copper-sensing transcriptional repressor